MRVMNLEQGSDDWLVWRQGGLGATTAPILLDLCPLTWQQSRQRLWEELTGRRQREAPNVAMLWGRDLEPLCRQFYERLTGITMHPTCVVHDRHDWLRASLDGLNLQARLLLEIKVCNKGVHQLCLDGCIPDYYHAQVQHQLMVTGLQEAHYFTHNNKSFTGENQWGGPLTVTRDEDFLRHYFDLARSFWQCVQEDKPPVAYFGWYKAGRQRKWRRVVESETEQECGELLQRYIEATEEAHTELYVGMVGVDPNRRVRA